MRRVAPVLAVDVAVAIVVAVVAVGCTGAARAPDAAPHVSEVSPHAAAASAEAFARDHGLDDLPLAEVVVVPGDGGAPRVTVTALVAATPEAQARGLMGVAAVPEGVGMLFVFPDPPGPGGRPGFWMLDTLVDLDIAFVADGTVVGVATMRPCRARPCPITHPGVAYDAALEVAAGVLTGAGIVVGDALTWREVRAPG